MSRVKRQQGRKPHRTRYKNTGSAVNLKIFKRGEKKNHAVRDGPFTLEFYSDVLNHARAFDIAHTNFIYAYQVIIFAIDNDTRQEFSFTVQNLRAIRFKQDDADTFEKYVERAEEILNKSSTHFEIRFMRIILVSEKSMKHNLDVQRQERAEKQRISKSEAKHERQLQAAEKEKSRIRKEREKNKKLRELGLLKPAKKKPSNKRKVWI